MSLTSSLFRSGVYLSALMYVCISAIPAIAAPINDNFANAIPLSGATGTVYGSTIGATAQAGEPNCAGGWSL